jgi:hypothetical protein
MLWGHELKQAFPVREKLEGESGKSKKGRCKREQPAAPRGRVPLETKEKPG